MFCLIKEVSCLLVVKVSLLVLHKITHNSMCYELTLLCRRFLTLTCMQGCCRKENSALLEAINDKHKAFLINTGELKLFIGKADQIK